MALHLIKLCVGCDGIDDLEAWIAARLEQMRATGQLPEQLHTTRMIPRRAAELLDGGCLYWVIRGNVQARQRLLDIRPFRDPDGVQRCHLVLDPRVAPTDWHPRRAFQGWRYLQPSEAPRDAGDLGEGLARLPMQLRRELASLGLL